MKLLALPPVPTSLAVALAALEREGWVRVLAGPGGDAAEAEQDADVLVADAAGALERLAPAAGGPWPQLVVVHGEAEAALRALQAGADLWLDPAEPAERLAARLGAVLRRARRGGEPAAGGPLSRAALERRLAHEFDRAQRYRRSLAVIALSAPRFEAERLPGLVRPLVRDVDALARIGAERLVLLLPETDASGAATVAQRVRGALGADTVLGVAAFPTRGMDGPAALLGRALEALAHGLRAGGGVVPFGAADVIWSREAPDPSTF